MSVADSNPTAQENFPSQRDTRLLRLAAWLEECFGGADFTLAPASADASFRRYFRVTRAMSTTVAMDAPPDKEDIRPFIRVAEMLGTIGINAPRIHERNLGEGFLLLSDLGNRTYLQDLANGVNADVLYADALTTLVRMQAHTRTTAADLPSYDEALLMREMHLFPDWFLKRHLAIDLDTTQVRAFEDVFALLAQEALAQPKVFVHRDYHSRNLMVCEGPYGSNPGVLDFQDAVYGPITYDLVSLLKDCYVAWPPARVLGWVSEYRSLAGTAGLDVGTDMDVFLRWFDFMGMQRHFKAIGIFSRLWHRDGKQGYLKDIPRTLAYVADVAARYPEFAPVGHLLEEHVMPVLEHTADHDASAT